MMEHVLVPPGEACILQQMSSCHALDCCLLQQMPRRTDPLRCDDPATVYLLLLELGATQQLRCKTGLPIVRARMPPADLLPPLCHSTNKQAG